MPTPSRTSLFTAQLTQHIADLQQCTRTLADVMPPGPDGRAVIDRFDLLVRQPENELIQVRVRSEHDACEDWRELDRVRKSAAKIKQEVLSFTLGALLRDKGLDGGSGEVAKRLLDDITGRTGVDRRVLLSVSDGE